MIISIIRSGLKVITYLQHGNLIFTYTTYGFNVTLTQNMTELCNNHGDVVKTSMQQITTRLSTEVCQHLFCV
jgi:hypothetical protein